VTFVKDTAEAAWTKDGVYLWHRVDHTERPSATSCDGLPESYAVTACGHWVKDPVEFIDHEMSFADWDREYGDDVDLCQCAVSAPKDVAKVYGFMKGSLDDE
jgi:hypothetical protein